MVRNKNIYDTIDILVYFLPRSFVNHLEGKIVFFSLGMEWNWANYNEHDTEYIRFSV